MRNDSSERQITNLWTALIVLILLSVGIGLVIIASQIDPESPTQALSTSRFFNELGKLLIVGTTVSLIWELINKRAFMNEFYAKAQLSEKIRRSGLSDIAFASSDFSWHDLISKANQIDLFFVYARTWRSNNEVELRKRLQGGKLHLRVILPDPEDRLILDAIANRHTLERSELKERILEATTFFSRLVEDSKGRSNLLEIWYARVIPMLSFHRFDDKAVLGLYTHQRQKTEVPHLLVCDPGGVFDFIKNEIDALVREGTGRTVKRFESD